MRYARLALSLTLAVLLVRTSPSQSPVSPDRVNMPAAANAFPGGSSVSGYRLNLSDTLDLQLPYSPEYNQTVTVQPDGRVSLREIEPVRVAGLSLTEAEAAVAAAYGSILRQPKVSILLRDFQKPAFYASGELGRPGRYDLRRHTTLFEAISEAGGLLNERAQKKQVVVFRPQSDGMYEAKVLDVKAMLKAKSPQEPFLILPGDVIYVPQNRISKIQRYIPTPSVGAYLAPTLF